MPELTGNVVAVPPDAPLLAIPVLEVPCGSCVFEAPLPSPDDVTARADACRLDCNVDYGLPGDEVIEDVVEDVVVTGFELDCEEVVVVEAGAACDVVEDDCEEGGGAGACEAGSGIVSSKQSKSTTAACPGGTRIMSVCSSNARLPTLMTTPPYENTESPVGLYENPG